MRIEIKGLQIYAYHGVMPAERRIGNLFSLDISVTTDFSKALLTDDVTDTVSYAAIVETARRVMAQPSNLIEHVAGRLRDAIIAEYPQVTDGHIRIAKLHPPISAQLDSVAVTLDW